MASQLSRTRRLLGEPLEGRNLLSVTAQVANGTLCITGDAKDNCVTVTQDCWGQVIVSSSDWRYSKCFSKVTNLTVNLDGGCDTLAINAISLKGDVCVNAGVGDDKVTIGPSSDWNCGNVCIGGSLSIDLGAGCNTLCQSGTTVKGNESVCAGDQNDKITIGRAGKWSDTDVEICGSLTLTLGCGDNSVCQTSTKVNQCETITTGDGKDDITIGRSGDPSCVDVNVGKDLAIDLGAGKNCLTGLNLAVCGALSVSSCAKGTNNPDNVITFDRLRVGGDATLSLLGCGCQTVSIGSGACATNPPDCHENSIGGNLKITTGSGNDTVKLASLTIGGCSTICTDGGDDTVRIGTGGDVTACKDVSVDLGKGKCDSLAVDCAHVAGNFCATGGADQVSIDLENLLVGQLLSITTGKGKDSVTIGGCTKADALKVYTDGGDDCVTLCDTTFKTANISLGSSDRGDKLSVSKSAICDACFDGGAGRYDTYVNGGGNDFGKLVKKNFERYS
jgi:hypothetical protein